MKPVNIGGHSAYQDRVLTQLRKYYPNAASLSSSTWQIIDKFWNLNLSQVDELMKDRYSVFGPEPRLPSDMLRAILVSAAFKITSYTRFAADLKENPLHAIISGFFVGDTPGVGHGDILGSVEEGKKADLILLNIDQPHITPSQNLVNTIVDAANGHDVTDSIINGKIVMKNREVLTLDEERIRFEAEKHMNDIIKRAY